MVLCCVSLMIAALLVPAGSAALFLGLCAGFFLPLATYGPLIALIRAVSPNHMPATATGLTMLAINLFAIAIGAATPLSTVLLGVNILIGLSLLLFWQVSRCGDTRLRAERDRSVVAY